MSTGIMIIGPSGSGKTTLGKIVAQKLGYPYFDVDDYIWKQNTDSPYTQMYTREEKISRLSNDIASYEHFVMAGSMSSFHYAFDDMFEMMVLLYVEPDIRIQRVHKRAIERFGGRVLEGGDMYESHMKFLKDNRSYEEDGSPNMREQKEWMKNMSCVKIELDGVADLESNADIIKTITFNDVDDKDESHYGLKGSATQVERIFEPDKKEDRKMIKDGDLALETFNILKTKKFI